MSRIKIGTFTSAAGAAQTIDLGFKPDYVKVINQTAAIDTVMGFEWFGAAQGDEKAVQTFALLDNGTATTRSPVYDATATTGGAITNTGSTPSVSGDLLSFSGEEGFIVSAGFLTTSDVCWYVALQSD